MNLWLMYFDHIFLIACHRPIKIDWSCRCAASLAVNKITTILRVSVLGAKWRSAALRRAARKTFLVLVVTPRHTPSDPENNVAWLEGSPLIPCQIRNLRPRHVDRWKFRTNLSFWNSSRENWHLNSETNI